MNVDSTTNLKLEISNLQKELDVARGLLDSANSIIIRWDKDGVIHFMNDFGLRFFGYSSEELIGHPLMTIVPNVESNSGRDMSKLAKDIVENPEQYKTVSSENITKNGRTVWVTWTNKGILDRQGNVQEIFAIGNDITALKTAEETLRHSEERFRVLFDQAGGYCMILDPQTADGIPVIVDANQAACEMHGYSREEFIGRPVAEIDDADGKRMVKERTREILTGKPFYVENVHVRKDGTTFHVAVNAKRIDIGAAPPLILSTEFDITALKTSNEKKKKAIDLLNSAEKVANIGSWE